MGKDADYLYIKAICGPVNNSVQIRDVFCYNTDVNTFLEKSYMGDSFLFSDYTLPNDHEITIKFKNEPDLQITCGDYTHVSLDSSLSWIYAWNIYRNDVVTRDQSNNVIHSELFYTLNKDFEYKIRCKNNVIQLYVNNLLIFSKTTWDVQNITRLIRLYPLIKKNNIEYIIVHGL